MAPGHSFPMPGVRRLMPPSVLSGLASIDCQVPADQTPRVAFDVSGMRDYAQRMSGKGPGHRDVCPRRHCSSAPASSTSAAGLSQSQTAGVCPDQVTDLAWPDYYRPPLRPQIRGASKTNRTLRQKQRQWYGKDVACASFSDCSEANDPERASKWEATPLGASAFDEVVADVAARSFNGREVVLLTSNMGGLPLVINLVANLAQVTAQGIQTHAPKFQLV